MEPGQAIPPAIVEMDEGTRTEGAWNQPPLVSVMKCPACGHSFATKEELIASL